jgi:hypothetical protein
VALSLRSFIGVVISALIILHGPSHGLSNRICRCIALQPQPMTVPASFERALASKYCIRPRVAMTLQASGEVPPDRCAEGVICSINNLF